jgi:phosphohistidine phosphatase SixA
MVFALVRHGHAGDKKQWKLPDAIRPLSEHGWQQSAGLAENLAALATPRLLSSPFLRCQQTLRPLAMRSGLSIEDNDLLAPNARTSRLDDFLTDPALDGAVLCTHGETLTALMDRWLRHGTVQLPADRAGLPPGTTEKGAAWIIVDDGVRSAYYLRPLHIGPVLGSVPAVQ